MAKSTPQSLPVAGLREVQQSDRLEHETAENRTASGKKIWVDLDNSPHVPFFLPIIDELKARGFKVVLTARNSYQVCELLSFNHLVCKVIGKHWGKHRLLKIFGTCWRALQLLPFIIQEKPDLAVSHGSRAQELASVLMRLPSISIFDYEYASHLSFIGSKWVFVPQYIPSESVQHGGRQVMKYPGLKEDVYVPRFRPDASIRATLHLRQEDIVVTVRPPATEAHYHNPEADVLLDASLNRLVRSPGVRVVLVPRNAKQEELLRAQWHTWIDHGNIVVPDRVFDGLNLIWFSDLVISGGGTMNREAAALGVPVYSIFRGRIGAVDRYLASCGRLTLIESVQDVDTKIKIERHEESPFNPVRSTATLVFVVNGIASIAEHACLPNQGTTAEPN